MKTVLKSGESLRPVQIVNDNLALSNNYFFLNIGEWTTRKKTRVILLDGAKENLIQSYQKMCKVKQSLTTSNTEAFFSFCEDIYAMKITPYNFTFR